jgi:hypothetical protein
MVLTGFLKSPVSEFVAQQGADTQSFFSQMILCIHTVVGWTFKIGLDQHYCVSVLKD